MGRQTPGNYVPLDVNYARDSAIRVAGEAAELLFVRGLAYCKGARTDGFIPDYDLPVVAVGLRSVARRVAALVDHGLWVRVEGGHRVRSWVRWNTPVSSEDEFTAGQSKHGARGNHERWHAGRGVTDPDCSYCTDPNRVGESGTRSAGRIANKGREGKGREEEQLPSSADAEAAFNDFYSTYPRKVGRKAAHDAFMRALHRSDTATILDACRRYAADPNQPTDRSKIPHPTTWLNQGRWDDEPLPPRNVHHLPTAAGGARLDPWDR